MTADDCLNLIIEKLNNLRDVRDTKRIELSCLNSEIDRLEMIKFDIEIQIDKDKELVGGEGK